MNHRFATPSRRQLLGLGAASLAALTPNDPRFQPGFEHVDTRIEACVPFYGVFDFLDRAGDRVFLGRLALGGERERRGGLVEVDGVEAVHGGARGGCVLVVTTRAGMISFFLTNAEFSLRTG